MKAIHLTGYGNPAENLKMVEGPEPNAPSAGEALVRMEYAPVAYSDLLFSGRSLPLRPQLPSVIGAARGNRRSGWTESHQRQGRRSGYHSVWNVRPG